jgi:predicted TIM-barrel fold metal-dependent hydrolase
MSTIMASDTGIRDCIAPDRNPRKPIRITFPKGTIDTHVHVFEKRYPLSPARGYNPPDSTLDDLKHLHATLGVDRVVFTQPSPYGTDNSAIMDGMNALNAETPDRARCVIACGLDISEEEIAEYDRQGARGVRLNTDNKGGMPMEFSDIPELEAKIGPFGWHIEFLFPGKDIVELMPVLSGIKVPVTIAHFAYQPATAGIEAPGFQALLSLVRDGNTYVKISGANRVSETDLPPYDDVKPMAEALIEANEDRMLWGTDWPHPNKYQVNPNDGDLADAFADWVSDDRLRRKILVDNAAALYRF